MDEGSEGVGARVATLRKLAGWTQYQLAAHAFVSTSLVKQVEQGRTPPSAAFVACCAQALGVEVRELHGIRAEEAITELHSEWAGIAELREALHAFDDPSPSGAPLGAQALNARLGELERLRRGQRFAELATALPQALHHLFALVERTSPGAEAGEQARSMMHDAYRLAATAARHFRHPDIAATASERHTALAPATGDALRVALSDWHRCAHFLQSGSYDAGSRMLDRALARVADGPQNAASRGMATQLHLRAAVMAARGGDAERADDHIGQARRSCAECDPTPYLNTDASRLNVEIHWCAVPVERDSGAEALDRASRVTIADPTRPERVAHHHIDQARAWLLHGDRERALASLGEARGISPQQTRTHPSVRETVRAIAAVDSRATGTLSGFARWVGVRM